MIELKKIYELCNIWRLRPLKTKDLLFGKIIGLALFSVDWTLFVSNILKESVYKTHVLADHSSILLALDMIKESQRGKGFWKFNSSLLSNK